MGYKLDLGECFALLYLIIYVNFVKSFRSFTDVVSNKQTMNEAIIKQDNHTLEKRQS